MSSESPAAILFDTSGNPVGVVLDGVVYRLQVDAKLVAGSKLSLVDDAGDSAMDGTNNAVRVNIVAGSGGSGGTQYNEDVASAGGELLTLAGAIRQDSPTSTTSDDGDFANLKTDSLGRLWVNASGAAIPVTDNSGSITVDGAVTVSGTVDTEITTADLDIGGGTDTRAVVGLVYGASGGGVLVSTSNPLPIGDNGGSVTVDGTVTANAGAGTFAVDQANAAEADYDTGGGTVTQVMFGLALPASGGPVAGGTSTNPIRIDPTGTTAQPITDNSGSLTIDNTTLSVVGGGVEAAALRVTIANDSTGLISVDDNGNSLTTDTSQLPASLVGGRLDVNAGAWLGSTAPTVGQKTMVNSIPVVLPSDQLFISGQSSGNTTSATLVAGATFTGDWESTIGYISVGVLIRSNVNSQANSVFFEWSTDGISTDRSVAQDYNDAPNGVFYGKAVQGEYFRIRYINGLSDQSVFRLETIFHTQSFPNNQFRIDETITSANLASMARSVITAKKPDTTFTNIDATANNNLRVCVNEFGADTPIKALTTFQTNQANVLVTATQIVGSPLSGRKTVSIKSLGSNNQKIYIGTSAAVTTGNGYELLVGDSVEIEIDGTTSIWAISDSGTQRVCWLEVA